MLEDKLQKKCNTNHRGDKEEEKEIVFVLVTVSTEAKRLKQSARPKEVSKLDCRDICARSKVAAMLTNLYAFVT